MVFSKVKTAMEAPKQAAQIATVAVGIALIALLIAVYAVGRNGS